MFMAPIAAKSIKNLFQYAFLVFFAAFLLLLGFSLAHCRHYANQNYFYYVQQAYDPYTEGVPMEEMDLARLEYVFDPGVVNHDAIDALEPITTLPLPDSITYYTREDGRFVPAFTLEAGEEMLVFPSGKMTNSRDYAGYGYKSFPTYWKGWRYARPFVPEAEYDPDGTTYYYVKLRDLEKLLVYVMTKTVWRDFFQENTRDMGLGWTIWDTARLFACNADRGLRNHHIYNSADDKAYLWNPALTLTLSLTLLSGLGWLIPARRAKRKK